VDASFVIFPTEGCINISARSLGNVNVQVIMEAIGGGGHLTMAGTQIEGKTMEQVHEELIDLLNKMMPQVSSLPATVNEK
jgi:c-di-AMP phosphodiesterase-like protein